MSDLDNLLKKRRSIRTYNDRLPDDEIINQLLETVIQYPSPSNLQPVRIIRIKSFQIREKLQSEMDETHKLFLNKIESMNLKQKIKNWVNSYYRYSRFMFNAPVLFAIGSVENEKSFLRVMFNAGLIDKNTRGATDIDISVGLALQPFLLKAVELGLATCILSAPLNYINNVEKILEVDTIQVKCFLTLGYPAETPSDIPRCGVSDIYQEI